MTCLCGDHREESQTTTTNIYTYIEQKSNTKEYCTHKKITTTSCVTTHFFYIIQPNHHIVVVVVFFFDTYDLRCISKWFICNFRPFSFSFWLVLYSAFSTCNHKIHLQVNLCSCRDATQTFSCVSVCVFVLPKIPVSIHLIYESRNLFYSFEFHWSLSLNFCDRKTRHFFFVCAEDWLRCA